MEEVGTDAVVLVDIGDTGNAVAACLTPNGLGLGLNACDCVEDCDSTVENAKGTLDLSGEVDVARGVDDLEAVLDIVLLPEARGSSGGDGYTALLLLNHPVHGGSALMNLTDLMGFTRVVENTLGRGGFARVNVGHNTDVTRILQSVGFSHGSKSLPYQR